jgi:hypothetical protein
VVLVLALRERIRYNSNELASIVGCGSRHIRGGGEAMAFRAEIALSRSRVRALALIGAAALGGALAGWLAASFTYLFA